ncbi:MAG: MBL fold metallo-hydrolase [Syntrophales bacterium]|nr:MBL fold metallo-hydrolase [Syntrophales bacterium]
MQVIFLGTNGWYDTATGNTISILVRSQDYDLVFDAGYGIAKVDRYRNSGDTRAVFLFLSHFHLDHIAGLHTLVKLPFRGGLTICGPAGTRDVLSFLVRQPFTIPLAELPYSTTVWELPAEVDRFPFPVLALPLLHASLTSGLRISLDGVTIAYCPDTGYCENAVRLAEGADLLIAECAYPSGMGNESWPHLNPETAARLAWEGGAKRLALVHFDAHQYPTFADRDGAEAAARRVFPQTVATRDGDELTVP